MAASGRKSKGSSQWATQENGQLSSSGYPEILKELTNDQQDIKNKIIKFVLDLDSKAHIGK